MAIYPSLYNCFRMISVNFVCLGAVRENMQPVNSTQKEPSQTGLSFIATSQHCWLLHRCGTCIRTILVRKMEKIVLMNQMVRLKIYTNLLIRWWTVNINQNNLTFLGWKGKKLKSNTDPTCSMELRNIYLNELNSIYTHTKTFGNPSQHHNNSLCFHQKRWQWYVFYFLGISEYCCFPDKDF